MHRGNPLSMATGIAALNTLKGKNYNYINNYAKRMEKSLNDIINDYKINGSVNRAYSMFQIFFNDRKVNSYGIAKNSDAGKFKRMFDQLLKKGIYVPPSQFETQFISFAHDDNDLQKTMDAYDTVLKCL